MFYLTHLRTRVLPASAAVALLLAEPARCSARDAIIHAMASPASAMLLLGVGILSICGELCAPGLAVPGAAGAVCVVLALNSTAVQAFDSRGVAMLVAALGFAALEAFRPTRGMLTLAGAALIACGLPALRVGVAWPVAVAAAAIFAPLLAFLLSVAVAARRCKLAILEKEGPR